MPQYLLLIYKPEDNRADPRASSRRWGRKLGRISRRTCRRQARSSRGDALERADTATTVRERDGQTQFTDGPFAETKEFLAGYYLVDCPDLDTALDHASHMPNIAYGSVEVRPMWDRTGPMAAGRQQVAQA